MGTEGPQQAFHLSGSAYARDAHIAAQQRETGRFHACEAALRHKGRKGLAVPARQTVRPQKDALQPSWACLLYTSDAADD